MFDLGCLVCGGAFRSNVGYVISPNYPNSYEPNLYCEYTIEPPSAVENVMFTVIEFLDFDIESKRIVRPAHKKVASVTSEVAVIAL